MSQTTSKRKSMWDASDSQATPVWNARNTGAILPQPVVEQLRIARKRVRNRDWEKEAAHRTTSYRGVPADLQGQIRQIAGSLDLLVDEVARAFLEYGLKSYQSGRLSLHPVLRASRLTLLPEASAGRRGWREPGGKVPKHLSAPGWMTQPASNPKNRPKQRVVSYRGLPPELTSAIRELQRENHVPTGEVVTLLLTYSLAAYHSGSLVFHPPEKLV